MKSMHRHQNIWMLVVHTSRLLNSSQVVLWSRQSSLHEVSITCSVCAYVWEVGLVCVCVCVSICVCVCNHHIYRRCNRSSRADCLYFPLNTCGLFLQLHILEAVKINLQLACAVVLCFCAQNLNYMRLLAWIMSVVAISSPSKALFRCTDLCLTTDVCACER